MLPTKDEEDSEKEKKSKIGALEPIVSAKLPKSLTGINKGQVKNLKVCFQERRRGGGKGGGHGGYTLLWVIDGGSGPSFFALVSLMVSSRKGPPMVGRAKGSGITCNCCVPRGG